MKRNKKNNNKLNIINYFNYIIIIINILCNQLLIINCKECETIDVRNNPSKLQQLRNCTVIKGYLQIVLIQANDKYTYSDKDYVNYKFPELREVTEFVIFFDVAGLTSLGKLFPNLMVIRGKKLFLNYALAIDSMPDLKQLDLSSLVSIQRGSVYINRNPNLCYLESINWDQLTENKVGMNFYKSMQPTHCLSLIGCSYYWSSLYCQKFRNDNVLSSKIKAEDCNPQCLGGCWNHSDTGCAVCKGITDDGRCVEKCPDDKYLAEDHLRCYTKTRCMEQGRHILNSTCVKECPPGYIDYKNEQHQSDFTCHPCTKCAKTCHVIDEIQYLSDAEIYKGCTTIKGNLSIRILSKIDIKHLEDALGDITEIQDFLKVYRTTSITSLNFLRSLKIIHGETLESDNYALSVYENRNLKNLWNWKEHENLIINNGGIFLHSNYKLCSYEIIQLKEHIKHDNSTDSIQENDEEILCEPFKLNVTITEKTHEYVTLEWLKDKNTDKTQILYKKIKNENVTIDDDDYDDNICSRETWIKQILLHDDLKLSNDNNNWIYNLTELQQNTWYALRIKTYGEIINSTYQSDFIRFKTEPDIPLPPQVYTLSKTSNSITLTWKIFTIDDNDNYDNDYLNYKNQLITHYLIDIFYQPDNQDILDTRNYCTDPLKQTSSSNLNGKIDDQYDQINNTNINNYNDNGNENIYEQDDYDNCCNRIEDELEDREFISLIDEKFRCSRNSNIGNSCKIGIYHTQLRRRRHYMYLNGSEELIPDAYKSKYMIKSEVITEPFKSSYKIENLNYYTLYIFQFFACNDIGCSSYGLHSDRTAPLLSADNLYLTIEKGRKHNEYLLYFPQPESPNGLTVAYNIEYRSESNNNGNGNGDSNNSDNDTPFTGSIQCITRLEHERNNYRYSIKINNRNFSARVRSISLAGPGLPTDWIFYKIEQPNNNEINYNGNKQNNEIDDNNNGEGMDPIVIFCLISLCCILAILSWIAYKKLILSRTITASESNIDEQILMQDFETNNLDDSIEESDM